MKAASVYGRIGWAVLPLHSAIDGVCSCSRGSACPNAGKHPRLRDWVEEATSDAEQIAEWAAQWPNANVGVATGAASGFWVLDVDPGNGGPQALAELVGEHGDLPDTVTAETGSGGTHYLFALPEGSTVTNTASKIAPGLDTRGDGGQIVVAPSVSAKGPYRWVVPPWAHPIADAPEWLLEMLQRAPQRAAAVPEGDRPAFPTASPEVLEAARLALGEHGPAVEGNGGDQHTFVAAALLVHDFALTDDEAWPLLVEWNETCQPAWEEDDLRAKLRGGSKYASKAYGCRRALDAVDAVRADVAAWMARGSPEGEMWALIDRSRHFASLCGDSAKHAVISRELTAATGLTARALDLPAPALPPEAVPEDAIVVTPRVHEVADAAVKAIKSEVFARNGVLCEVVKAPERTFIADLEVPRIVDLMSKVAKWVRQDESKGLIVQAPPQPVAQILHARRTHAGVRPLEGVTTAPVFLADGTILQTRGYSRSARLFLEPSVAVDVPDEPTRDDARDAIRVLKDLVCDFRFAEKGDFSSWLAGLLSPLVKAAISNAPVPLICISASTPGAGKSLLAGITARIITGGPAEIRPYNPKDPGEWGKRITAFVRAASPVSVFDNVNGPFGDETIDRLVTSSTWSDRVLGASDAPPIPVVGTWWATGNNIEPIGDTVRRVLLIKLEVLEERPQERTGFKRANLEAYVDQHRGDLLSAALTILRAFHVAGRPDQGLAPWGSFDAWSALVRGALVWCGLTDPYVTQRRAAHELGEQDSEAHDFWLSVVDESDGTMGSIVLTANQRGALEVLGLRESITAFTLKRHTRRFIDRPRKGRRLRREGGRLYVEQLSA